MSDSPPVARIGHVTHARVRLSGWRWSATVAFLAAVAITLLAVWPVPRWEYRDLHPVPDAPEYLAGAVSLATTGEHGIELAGERHPSRYPIGFSATLVPLLWLGLEPIRVPFVASAAAALLLLAMLGLALRRWTDGPVAGLGVLLLATTTGFLALARAPMADLTAAAWVSAGLAGCIAYMRAPRLWIGAGAALLLGLAVTFKLANAFFAAAVLTSWCAARSRLPRPWRDAAVLAVTFAVALLPLLVAQVSAFGSPWANGYQYWLADRGVATDAFRLEFLDENLRYLAREFLQLETRQLVATSHGSGGYFGPAGALLLAICTVRAWRHPAARWLTAGVACYAVALLFYFFPDARFFAPLFPLAAGLVAWQSAALLRHGSRRVRIALGLLLASHVLGVPGSRSIADLPALLAHRSASHAWRYELVTQLQREPAGLVLVGFNPPYAKALLGAAWLVTPALDEHDYQHNPARFRFGSAERDAIVRESLGRGLPVHAVAEHGLPAVLAANQPPPGMRWELLRSTAPGGGIARLRRE